MAITDEEITDEVLVQEFERMTMKRHLPDPDLTKRIDWDPDDEWDVWEADRACCGNIPSDVLLSIQDPPDTVSKIPYTPSLPSFPTRSPLPTSKPATRSATTPSATWHAARRALLTCRELVRTERHYLTSLQSLLASETVTAPPPLMLHYVEELSTVSQMLVAHMEKDPSAWGVAAAFLAVEQGLETAFLGWCGIVGAWFEGQDETLKRKSGKIPSEPDQLVPLKRSVSMWRISVPSMTPMTSPVSPSAFLTRRKDKARDRPSGPPKRRPSVRDLAILPTQRITRYVLLYRGAWCFVFFYWSKCLFYGKIYWIIRPRHHRRARWWSARWMLLVA